MYLPRQDLDPARVRIRKVQLGQQDSDSIKKEKIIVIGRSKGKITLKSQYQKRENNKR